MAYTSYTKAGKFNHKKVVSLFCTDFMRPTAEEVKGGVVLGYLPPKIIVLKASIVKKVDNPKAENEQNLYIGGKQINPAENQYFELGGALELKHSAATEANEDYMILVHYMEVASTTGNYTETPTITIASDGSIAKED